MAENDQKAAADNRARQYPRQPEAARPGEAVAADTMQWVWLALGVVMAIIGGSLKASDVLKSPAVFEYVFFAGPSYILLVAGLALTIIALGYDLVFGPGGEDS